MRALTKAAVFFGRVITERRPLLAAMRNRVMRAAMKVPYLPAMLHATMWIPEARYRDGYLAGDGAAVGRQLPQPWMVDEKGTGVRLDDALAGRWTLLHRGTPPSGCEPWTTLGVNIIRLAGPEGYPTADSLIDGARTLISWLHRYGAHAVIVRPDGFVFAAVGTGQALPPPPPHLRITSTTTAPQGALS